ncbi:hypothetical protein EYR36_009961 [Pleurotus pulmonarius]|nr:hypothetical protein EYR36_009961 [Pleurotus pulmonarius]
MQLSATVATVLVHTAINLPSTPLYQPLCFQTEGPLKSSPHNLHINGAIRANHCTFGILSLVSNSFLNYIVTWPMFSSTVMANIIITGMITFKVWKTTRASAALFSASYSTSGPMSHTWSILQTLLESAGLYTLGVILTAVSPLFSGNSFGAFLSAMGPLIGIAFSLILLLAGLGRTAENSSNAMAPTLLVFHHSNADSDD